MYLYMLNQKCYSPRKGARIVAFKRKIYEQYGEVLQSPQGARIVAKERSSFGRNKVTVPARGANFSVIRL